MRREAKRLAEMKEIESVSDRVYCYLTYFLILYINLLWGAGDGRGGGEGKTGGRRRVRQERGNLW